MKDLFTVAKEATSEVRRKYPTIDTVLLNNEQLEDLKNIVEQTYTKQSFLWKMKNPFGSYKQMVMLDFKHNFIGGAVLNPNGNTVINIK
jgi:hypothetical protein